jgi:hypothetical protein
VAEWAFSPAAGHHERVFYSTSQVSEPVVAKFIFTGPGGELLDSTVVRTENPHLTTFSTPEFTGTSSSDYRLRIETSALNPSSRTYLLYRASHDRGSIPIGDTVEWQALDNREDVDRFQFQGSAGQEIVAYLQRTTGSSAAEVVLGVGGPSGTGNEGNLGSVTSKRGDSHLWGQSTGRIELPTDGVYTVTVSAMQGEESRQNNRITYRFALLETDLKPEHQPQELTTRTVVREWLDNFHDQDEFHLTLAPGRSHRVFLQAEPNRIGDHFLLTTLTRDGDTLHSTVRVPQGGLVPFAYGSPMFQAPAPGTISVRIEGEHGALGTYRLLVQDFDSPEPKHLTLTDTITLAGIDHPTDIDEYTLTIPGNKLTGDIWVVGESTSFPFPAPVFHFYHPDTEEPITIPERSDGWHTFPGGDIGLRIGSLWGTNSYLGPYTVYLFPMSTWPEVAGRRIEIGGGAVDNEMLFPAGDRDWFKLKVGGPAYFEFKVSAGNSAAGYPRRVHADLALVGGSQAWVRSVWQPGQSDVRSSGRISPRPGDYEINVRSVNEPLVLSKIPFTLELVEVPSSTESADSVLTVGQVLASESMDYPGDIDVFVLHGEPGTRIRVWLHTDASDSSARRVEVFDLQNGRVVGAATHDGTEVRTEKIRVPTDGLLGVRVLEDLPPCDTKAERCPGSSFSWVGGYRIKTRVIEEDS